MKLEITVERQHRGTWRQHARGKFPIADAEVGPDVRAIEDWLKSKGVPVEPRKGRELVGWAIRVALSA